MSLRYFQQSFTRFALELLSLDASAVEALSPANGLAAPKAAAPTAAVPSFPKNLRRLTCFSPAEISVVSSIFSVIVALLIKLILFHRRGRTRMGILIRT